MATKPREHSESGFYHVFQRGVNLFDIFEDNVDRECYLDRLTRYARELGVEIHAWCLMSNHTHLLLRATPESLSAVMRKLGSAYARRFNRRHQRSGPLFEGRFGSVPVNTDAQLLSVIRYIHRNPIHHEERTLMGDYPWSSYAEYRNASPTVCQIEFALKLFENMNQFVRFHEEERDVERHLDTDTWGRMSDDEARTRANLALLKSGFNVAVTHLGTLPKDLRNKAISQVKRIVKCSLRQLQRLTAVAYSAIRAAVGFNAGDEPLNSTSGQLVESASCELKTSLVVSTPQNIQLASQGCDVRCHPLQYEHL